MAYPDADARKLDLLSDWCVLLWFVDDLFQSAYLACTDPQELNDRIDRLMMFMPVDPVVMPVPEHPAEHAVADLWLRTAGAMSREWRLRYTRHFRRFLEGSRWAQEATGEDRFPDPVDYIQLRRDFGATPATVFLLEHATGTEIPRPILESRPFQAIIDAVCDAAGLQNDVISYNKERAQGEADSNGVRIFQRTMDCNLQKAVDAVDRVLTSRVHTLQAAADIDLPRTLEELGTDPHAREALSGYVSALQSLLAGMYAWPYHTARYGLQPAATELRVPTRPTGLGTSAAHLAANAR
ncbi:hypothetical protein J7E97_29255 [Streptomyces sp. ISL-66]|uniref:terpene synthase family protein n=1 Tax=Streptomyces sp. ISL-66 TaxID=2819186 RepID=UPI001BECE3C0|nr:hypothetical protein [Streptomyces sp. ISL-66]MBT2471837.1 hypothetical protein [Streptomyces sp. ISL-66]